MRAPPVQWKGAKHGLLHALAEVDSIFQFRIDAKLSPSDLRITKITATSGEIQWLPAHSSYEHEIFLNEILLDCVKPGCASYAINDLSPSTSYQVLVRTQIPEHVKVTVGRVDQDSLSGEVEFTTAEGGKFVQL